MEYDRAAVDGASNPTIAFLDGEKEGVCRHYAQAATLLYRTLGLPARYTVGFVCDNMKKDQSVDVTDKQAHAWVEVYIEGTGWVYVEVTGSDNSDGDGSSDGGSSAGKPKIWKLKIAPTYAKARYGAVSQLAATAVTVTDNGAWATLESIGYKIEATFSDPATKIGITHSYVTSLKILDENGNTIYEDADGYGPAPGTLQWEKGGIEVTYESGTLKLYRAKVSLTTYSFSRAYGDSQWHDKNGNVYTFDQIRMLGMGYSYTFDEGTLADGHSINIVFPETNPLWALNAKVGSIVNACKFQILDASGNDVTNTEYDFSQEEGSLSVEARVIHIKAGSMTLEYTGEAQIYDETQASVKTQVTSGELAFDDKIDWSSLVITHEEAKAPGDYATIINTETIKVYMTDGDGNKIDITDCYAFVPETGVLTIIP